MFALHTLFIDGKVDDLLTYRCNVLFLRLVITCVCFKLFAGVELQDNRGFGPGEGVLRKLVLQCSSRHHQHASPCQVLSLR